MPKVRPTCLRWRVRPRVWSQGDDCQCYRIHPNNLLSRKYSCKVITIYSVGCTVSSHALSCRRAMALVSSRALSCRRAMALVFSRALSCRRAMALYSHWTRCGKLHPSSLDFSRLLCPRGRHWIIHYCVTSPTGLVQQFCSCF